ncbi:MAG: hypothetical protein KGJ58_02955 [Patescibacteria group bacterium]|nr:hypothetical protein [Patescibacteria group bacterium]MDE1988198.1 hypothetical protein [Patescibacteria group bacterium]MDE2218384.1 hypothetical protein [Patescibacteria group bacterium]
MLVDEVLNILLGLEKKEKITVSEYEKVIEEKRKEDESMHDLYGSCQYDLCSQIGNAEAVLCEVSDIKMFARKHGIHSPAFAVKRYYS